MNHPFVKMDAVTKEFVESAIYNQETGEKLLAWPVDAKEIVANGKGLWAYSPPAEKPEPVAAVAEESPVAEPAAEEPAAEAAPRKPGRPKKAT